MLARREIWNDIKELVLEEYRGSTNFLAFLRAVIEIVVQPLEDASVGLQGIADITEASGEWLDILGKIIGAERAPGESDDDYRDRLLVYSKIHNAGTPDNIIDNARDFSGDPAPQYMDEAPATFFVYDGPRPVGDGGWEQGGHQLTRAQVKRLAPAGVLGLPGAAVEMGDGSLLADANGKLILMAADDSTVEREVVLSDDTGSVVVTPQSRPVKAVITGGRKVRTGTATVGGTTVKTVRIKDLPDAGAENGYLVRDSETGGTVKTKALTGEEMERLWEDTPAEEEEDG